jgi:hypothetical protein
MQQVMNSQASYKVTLDVSDTVTATANATAHATANATAIATAIAIDNICNCKQHLPLIVRARLKSPVNGYENYQ